MNEKELNAQNTIHKEDIKRVMAFQTSELVRRAFNHDWSKLEDEGFRLLYSCLNGEVDMSEWENYHYGLEDHHPEYYAGVSDMSMMALVEMVADGAVAYYRRSGQDPVFENEVAFYQRKGFGEEMSTMLANEFMRCYNYLRDTDEMSNENNENFSGKGRTLLVTIPKSTEFDVIRSEIRDIENGLVGNHKLGRKPSKEAESIKFVYDGKIRFKGDLIKYEEKEFKCETTEKKWDKSWYAVFENVVEIAEEEAEEYKGFQGFRYIEEEVN